MSMEFGNGQDALQRRRDATVAHIIKTFLAGSQTFIYHYVNHHKRFKPVCLAYGFTNLEQFPFPADDLLTASHKRYTPAWAYFGAMRRYFGIDPLLTRQLKRSGCRIIHAHFARMGFIALSSKKSLGMPLVTTFYGYDLFNEQMLERYRKRYVELFRGGELFLVEGPNMRNRLIEIGCPPEKIEIQRIAIPLDDIDFRARRPKKKGEKARILFAGRFVEKKGLIFALKALKQAAMETNNYELRIVGDGPLRDSLEAFVQDAGLGESACFLGFLPYKEHLAEMEKADIFLHPSVTAANGDSEGGAPTVILEAQAHGLPVVSTYHADIPNVVIPEKSALLSQERDIESLANNILFLLRNQDSWAEMGREGRGFVEKYHDIEKEIDVLEERYQILLN